jgi:hypothetical protein
VPIGEILWLLFASLLGGVVACGVAYAFVGIERLAQLRRPSVDVATKTARPLPRSSQPPLA